MTEEYKGKLLDYVTGKLKISESFDSTPEFYNFKTEKNNLFSDLKILIANKIKGDVISCRVNGNLATDISIIVYGEYEDKNNSWYGYIAILDNSFKIKELITEYDGGTRLKGILLLEQDEDYNFYGIETYDSQIISERKRRFIMLNNFSIPIKDNYRLILRKSYFLPNNDSDENLNNLKKIKKAIGKSIYIIAGISGSGNGTPFAYKLKLNVGSENEWIYYSNSVTIGNIRMDDIYIDGKDDDIVFKLACCGERFESMQYYTYDWEYIEYDIGSNNALIPSIIHIPIDIKNFRMINNAISILNENTAYILFSGYSSSGTGSEDSTTLLKGNYFIYKIDRKTKKVKLLKYESREFAGTDSFFSYKIARNKNNLYFCQISSHDKKPVCTFGQIDGEKIYIGGTCEIDYNDWIYFLIFNVKVEFNLVTFYMQLVDYYMVGKEVYNEFDYNGMAYVNDDSLSSNSAKIFDYNDEIVFARNLYNKSTSNNVTVSTVEIPNMSCNGIKLENKLLLGKTNLILIANNKLLEKNIYEKLYINFINSINIKDNNCNSKNKIASAYLNNAINNKSQYENAKIYQKGIISYKDGSSRETNMLFRNIDNMKTEIIFSFFIDRDVDNLKIISNDKSTVYQSIDLSNLKADKYYKISETLEVI